MSRARDNANNWAADITAVSAGVGITGGGTSGAVTVTNEMATTIDAKGDLVVGSGADAFVRVPVGSNNQVLTADSATTSGVKWATADALPSQTGNSGKYLTTNGTTASWGTVNQPITWTQRIIAGIGSAIYTIAYNGSDLFVAAGGGGVMATSPDGITWTSRTSNSGGNAIWKVAFGNGLWVAVGNNGTITTSTDGITWTARTSNMGTNGIFDVTYDNSTWVAVGEGGGVTNTGGITYSTDGITWTRKSQSLTVGATYYAVVWNGTNWVVGASTSSNRNYLYASTPSGTWTSGLSGSNADIQNLFWDGTRHIEIPGNGASTRFSTSTTLGTSTAYTGSPVMRIGNNFQNKYYNGKIYTVGQGLLGYSTTPVSNYMGAKEVISPYLPTNDQNESTGFISAANVQTFWVGSLGYLISDNFGRIYSSF